MKSKTDRKEYLKAYYQSHKNDILAKRKAHYQAHRDKIKSYKKAYNKANRDKIKSYKKAYNKANRDKIKAYQKAYQKAYNKAHRDEKNAYQKADTNSNGLTKSCIRERSRRYLFNVLKHTKMDGYEIHHCFGYDDYTHFIYIPRALHMQIHQYLRDNNIDAETDHYSKIAHLVVAWEGYVFIKD